MEQKTVKVKKIRFILILLLLLLGVAFYLATRLIEKNMRISADAYYDQMKWMDIRVASTQGMTENDVAAISRVEGVREAWGAYESQAFYQNEGGQLGLQVFSLYDGFNQVEVTDGRLPEKPDECLVSETFAETAGCRIGDTISLTAGTEDSGEDVLAYTEFTITGYGSYSGCLTWASDSGPAEEKAEDMFAAFPRESFAKETYTVVYALAAGAEELTCYSDSYQSQVDAVAERIKAIEGESCRIRLAAAEETAENELAAARQQKEDAEEKLADSGQQLTASQTAWEEKQAEAAESEAELENKTAELTEIQAQLADGKQSLAALQEELNQKQKEAEESGAQLAAKKQEQENCAAEAEQIREQASALEREYQEILAEVSQIQQQVDNLPAAIEIEEGWAQYNQKMASAEEERRQIEEGEGELAADEEELEQKQAAFGAESDNFNYMVVSIDLVAPNWEAYQATVDNYNWLREAGNISEAEREMLSSLASFLDGFNGALGESLQLGDFNADQSAELIDAIVREASAAAKTPGDFYMECKDNAISQKRTQLDGQAAELDNERERLGEKRQDLADRRGVLNETSQELETMAQKLTEWEKSLAEAAEKLSAAQESLSASKGRMDDAKTQLSQKESELVSLQRAAAEQEQRLTDKQAELAGAEGAAEEARQNLGQWEAAAAKGEQESEEKEQELIKLQEELSQAEQAYQAASEEYEGLKTEMAQEIAAAQEKTENIQKEMNELETPVWSISDRRAVPAYLEEEENIKRAGDIGSAVSAVFVLAALLLGLLTLLRFKREHRATKL